MTDPLNKAFELPPDSLRYCPSAAGAAQCLVERKGRSMGTEGARVPMSRVIQSRPLASDRRSLAGRSTSRKLKGLVLLRLTSRIEQTPRGGGGLSNRTRRSSFTGRSA